jgi:hypothetical protein
MVVEIRCRKLLDVFYTSTRLDCTMSAKPNERTSAYAGLVRLHYNKTWKA